MKPLVLQGHSRPIRDIKFTPKGDLVFTASSDRDVIMWKTDTGEKIKTFTHKAAVNRIALTSDLNYMITGDLTGSLYVWDLNTSFNIIILEHEPLYGIKSIDFALNDYLIMILYATKGSKNSKSFINVYKFQDIINLTNNNLNSNNTDGQSKLSSENNKDFSTSQPKEMINNNNNDFFDTFKSKKTKNASNCKNNQNSSGN
jgi:WD40 repeat protein